MAQGSLRAQVKYMTDYRTAEEVARSIRAKRRANAAQGTATPPDPVEEEPVTRGNKGTATYDIYAYVVADIEAEHPSLATQLKQVLVDYARGEIVFAQLKNRAEIVVSRYLWELLRAKEEAYKVMQDYEAALRVGAVDEGTVAVHRVLRDIHDQRFRGTFSYFKILFGESPLLYGDHYRKYRDTVQKIEDRSLGIKVEPTRSTTRSNVPEPRETITIEGKGWDRCIILKDYSEFEYMTTDEIQAIFNRHGYMVYENETDEEDAIKDGFMLVQTV